jgi:hypothetical protein
LSITSLGDALHDGFPRLPPAADGPLPFHPFSTHDIPEADWLRSVLPPFSRVDLILHNPDSLRTSPSQVVLPAARRLNSTRPPSGRSLSHWYPC